MGSDNNKVILLDNNGNYPLEPATKIEVARSILKHVADMLQVK
jgi:phosphopantothenoylcysteine decarboxylase/phosphopantothenate--cysteine ligase